MSGHRPFADLRRALEARPGAIERMEQLGREQEREYRRLRWRLRRGLDRVRRSLF